MSAGGAFGGARGVAAKAPEKGVFPLDHFGECTEEKVQYIKCLRAQDYRAEECVEQAKAYLTCRMDRNLMAPQSLDELGLSGVYQPAEKLPESDATRTREGFVAGMRTHSGVKTSTHREQQQ